MATKISIKCTFSCEYSVPIALYQSKMDFLIIVFDMNRIVYPMVTREKSYLGSIWNCIAGVINRYFRDIQAILPFRFLWVYFYRECCLFNNIYMKRCRIIYIIWHLNVAQNLPLQKLFLIKANYTLLALTEKPFKNRRYNNKKRNISFYLCLQLSYILLYPKFNNIKKYLAYMNLLVWTTPLPKLFHSSIFPALTPISGPDSYWNDHTSTLHCLDQSLSRSTFHLK